MSKLAKLEKPKRDRRGPMLKLGKLKDDRIYYGMPKRTAFVCASTEMALNHSLPVARAAGAIKSPRPLWQQLQREIDCNT